jgi:hypothetical protein
LTISQLLPPTLFVKELKSFGIKLFSLNLIVSEQLCIPSDPWFRHLPNLQQDGNHVG